MKVLIADDHALFRDNLSLQLEEINPDCIILQASNFNQALKFVESDSKIALIVMDLDMPDMNWQEALKELKARVPQAKFVAVSAFEDSSTIRKSLEMGVSGYISKRSEKEVLNGALRLILEGGTYLPPSVLQPSNGTIVQDNAYRTGKSLTNRQNQVLGLVAQGLSNKQIAYEMGVSEATVKLHINALLRSVGATNRTQAVIMAQKMGII
ncbi:MAG: response regulator transcription factor [Alphaproteobacteria bacterium]|nr:response regulator transcription factor [Alphaproteobacteria bacterium]